MTGVPATNDWRSRAALHIHTVHTQYTQCTLSTLYAHSVHSLCTLCTLDNSKCSYGTEPIFPVFYMLLAAKYAHDHEQNAFTAMMVVSETIRNKCACKKIDIGSKALQMCTLDPASDHMCTISAHCAPCAHECTLCVMINVLSHGIIPRSPLRDPPTV